MINSGMQGTSSHCVDDHHHSLTLFDDEPEGNDFEKLLVYIEIRLEKDELYGLTRGLSRRPKPTNCSGNDA